MTFWYALATVVSKVPKLGWVLAGLVSVMTAVLLERASYGDRREAQGYARATRNAAFDSTIAAMAARARAGTTARTDTVVRRVIVTRARVDTVLRAMPDSVKARPDVAPLVIAVSALTVQVDSLTAQIDVERAAHRMEREVLAAQASALRSLVVVQQDTIRKLSKRPTRKAATWSALGAFAAGALAGIIMGLRR